MKKICNPKKSKTLLILLAGSMILQSMSCKKLIEVNLPIDKYNSQTVYSSTSTAVLALTGLYAGIRESFVPTDIARTSSELADELRFSQGTYNEYGLNNARAIDFFWTVTYQKLIYGTNTFLENVESSASIPESSKNIMIGEAKFLRAYEYFYLVNYYGDVPLVLSSDYTKNVNIGRSPKAEVYTQIVKDLTDAQSLLSNEFLGTDLISVSSQRFRANKAAATALLARVYLYNNEWLNAANEATKVINDNHYEILGDLNQVFLVNNRESIWQLQPRFGSDGSSNTDEGQRFIPDISGNPEFEVSPFLQNDFEPADLRNVNWLTTVNYGGADHRIPYKYKIGKTLGGVQNQEEATVMLRLAEQYLIRAEARAHLGLVNGQNSAESDLNVIRHRAGLNGTQAIDQTTMLDAIFKERRIEFFIESGHRWMDMKRTGRIDAIMGVVTPIKGGTWNPNKALMPIPAYEFLTNPTLRGHQNPGYSETN